MPRKTKAKLFRGGKGAGGAPPPAGGDITTMTFENPSASSIPTRYIKFGHLFAPGDVQTTDDLVVRIGATNWPVQMAVRNAHPDGSVRHAQLVTKAPALAGNATQAATLAIGSASTADTAPATRAALVAAGYNLTVDFDLKNNSTGASRGTASVDAATVLTGASSPPMWLDGQLAREWRVQTTIDSGKFKVAFDICAFADGTTWTDVIFDNAWFLDSGKDMLRYDVDIVQDAASAYSELDVLHYLYAIGHQEVEPTRAVVRYNLDYMYSTGAILNYDPSQGVSEGFIDYFYDGLLEDIPVGGTSASGQTRHGLIGTAMVNVQIPGTGGRPDIGPEPMWTAGWLVSQDARMRHVMLKCGDAAGNMPLHMMVEATGEPVDAVTYPHYWYKYVNVGDPNGYRPAPANGWDIGTNCPWVMDDGFPHHPELCFMPYIITGNRHRLTLLKFQGAHTIVSRDPWLRYYYGAPIDPDTATGANLYKGPLEGQVRGKAFGLRTLAKAAYAVPDSDALAAYFRDQLATSIANTITFYTTDAVVVQWGDIQGFIYHDGGGTPVNDPVNGTDPSVFHNAVWQQDYVAICLSQVALMEMGDVSDDARTLLTYVANYVAGRFSHEADGFPRLCGTGYYWFNQVAHTHELISTWQQLFDINVQYFPWSNSVGLPDATPSTFEDASLGALAQGGYADVAKASMAAIHNAVGYAGASAAFTFITNEITASGRTDYSGDPTWFLKLDA